MEMTLAGHGDGPGGHPLGTDGRGGDHDHLRLREHAGQPHLHIAGTWWHIDDHVVEVLGPCDVLEEVLHGPVEHQAPPHEGIGLIIDQQTHRDHVETSGTDRDGVGDDAALAGFVEFGLKSSLDTEHAGDGEPPDISVDDAHGEPALGEGGGEIRAHRRLAHASLARGDGQHPCTGRHPIGSGG